MQSDCLVLRESSACQRIESQHQHRIIGYIYSNAFDLHQGGFCVTLFLPGLEFSISIQQALLVVRHKAVFLYVGSCNTQKGRFYEKTLQDWKE